MIGARGTGTIPNFFEQFRKKFGLPMNIFVMRLQQ